MTQATYQAGPLAASLPVMTMADPLVAIVIGALAFAETVTHTPASLTAEGAGAAAMAAAVVALARRSSQTSAARTAVISTEPGAEVLSERETAP